MQELSVSSWKYNSVSLNTVSLCWSERHTLKLLSVSGATKMTWISLITVSASVIWPLDLTPWRRWRWNRCSCLCLHLDRWQVQWLTSSTALTSVCRSVSKDACVLLLLSSVSVCHSEPLYLQKSINVWCCSHMCLQKDSHTVYLEQELESLKVVLEIKNNQLHQKEKKIMEMDKLVGINLSVSHMIIWTVSNPWLVFPSHLSQILFILHCFGIKMVQFEDIECEHITCIPDILTLFR